MKKFAFYGKGGIGKSTTVSNIAAALAEQGLTVLQIGCDPKADSTIALRRGAPRPTILELVRAGKPLQPQDMITVGYRGVLCAEAGGPTPGLGCAGRGVIAALEKLEQAGAYELYRPDVVLYDVLGDVVCGGFTMPMRSGYADKVYILTSGENMSIYAAANIATAVQRFGARGYAKLGGFILNRRGVAREDEKAAELAADFGSEVLYALPRCELLAEAEEKHEVLLEAFPHSEMAGEYRALAAKLLQGEEGQPC